MIKPSAHGIRAGQFATSLEAHHVRDQMLSVDTASVKVMRSYDYCHFEVCLGSVEPLTPAGVDELRKTAARLADKAVAQYIVAKREAERRLNDEASRQYLIDRIERTRAMPEGDRTVSQQAELKAYQDEAWAVRREYDYEDDWNDA